VNQKKVLYKKERYSKEKKKRVKIDMPAAFNIYNKFMGGVDIHDQYCNKVLPSMRSKKWTSSIFMRLIQSSLTNSLIIFNTCCAIDKKMSIKDFSLNVVENYLKKARKGDITSHVIQKTNNRRYCTLEKCEKRSYWLCSQCNEYYCQTCFSDSHKIK